jgi:hypothetical protein
MDNMQRILIERSGNSRSCCIDEVGFRRQTERGGAAMQLSKSELYSIHNVSSRYVLRKRHDEANPAGG